MPSSKTLAATMAADAPLKSALPALDAHEDYQVHLYSFFSGALTANLVELGDR